jgi:hypothetical protein
MKRLPKKNKAQHMNKFMMLIGGATLLGGCSIYQATHAPTPVEYKQVKVGLTRTETISHLGYPKMTDQKDTLKIDSFEFLDGYNSASKARIILYLAGDIFTIGLAELIFWPIEANVFDGKQCRGTVTYDINDKVLGYELYDNDSEHLWFSPVTDPVSGKVISSAIPLAVIDKSASKSKEISPD